MDEVAAVPTADTASMAVVHVSGPLGCGKTCFGIDIAKLFAECGCVRVVNTDDLIAPKSALAKELAEFELEQLDNTETRYVAHWKKAFGELLDKEIRDAQEARPPLKVLLFVGCLDHYAPPGIMPLHLKGSVYRFCMKRHITHLLAMYYTRFRVEFKDDDGYWDDLYNGENYIPSSEEYIDNAVALTEWHLSNGYAHRTPEEIRAVIEELVNK